MNDPLKKGFDVPGVCVVYFCHDGQGNFVMAKRNANARDEHGRWDIGGGGLEVHDSVEETIRREILEEYCTEVLCFEFLGYRDVHREHKDKKTHWIALDFLVHVDRATVAIGEPHKFDDIGWFRLDSLPENIHSQLPNFLHLYRQKLNSFENEKTKNIDEIITDARTDYSMNECSTHCSAKSLIDALES